MHAALRRIATVDGDDPASFRPTEPDRFAVVLRLFVGPSPGNGEESFDVTVCTPLWLHDKCEREGFLIGRHHVVVLAYHYEAIQNVMRRLVERCTGATWQEIALKGEQHWVLGVRGLPTRQVVWRHFSDIATCQELLGNTGCRSVVGFAHSLC